MLRRKNETLLPLRLPPDTPWPVRGVDTDGGYILTPGFREKLAAANRLVIDEVSDSILAQSLAKWYLARRVAGHPVDAAGEKLLVESGIYFLAVEPPTTSLH